MLSPRSPTMSRGELHILRDACEHVAKKKKTRSESKTYKVYEALKGPLRDYRWVSGGKEVAIYLSLKL